MDTKIKKVGTREEVYNGNALRTAGGLQKNDIIEKKIGNRIIYISKKLSDKMKENITIIRNQNPHFFKRVLKKTIVSDVNTNQQSAINPSINPSINPQKQKKIITHPKTQKLSFKVKDNSVKTVYYPELKGMDLNELKEEILREEAEEDLGIKLPPKKLEEFSIGEMPDIDLSTLE